MKRVICRLLIIFSATALISWPCHAKNVQDLLTPVQSTLDWLDQIDNIDNTPEYFQSFDSLNYNQSDWKTELKHKSKTFRSYTQMQLSDHLIVKPARIKAKPYDAPGSQKGYGLKFCYQFN